MFPHDIIFPGKPVRFPVLRTGARWLSGGARLCLMKELTITIFILFFFNAAYCQNKIPVFISGTEGYKSFRIPAIIRLPNKDLLAFCEGRVNGASDFGNVDIVMKKSTDNGKTWGKLQILVDLARDWSQDRYGNALK